MNRCENEQASAYLKLGLWEAQEPADHYEVHFQIEGTVNSSNPTTTCLQPVSMSTTIRGGFGDPYSHTSARRTPDSRE